MKDFTIEGLFDFNKVAVTITPISEKGKEWTNKFVSPFCNSFTMVKTLGIEKYELLKKCGYAFEEV